MGAMSYHQQLLHQDLPLELQIVGVEHLFPCFMPVNLDCPLEGGKHMFVYGSGIGVPYVWRDIAIGMLVGDLWVLSNDDIHRGGALPREVPAGSSRIIAFAAIATRHID